MTVATRAKPGSLQVQRRNTLRESRSSWPGSYPRSCRICDGTPSAGGERVLQAAWKRLVPGSVVSGRDGDEYVVVYPGRPADGGGPDFRDAVLRGPDGTLMRGDVEIHVRASGWRAHGHHLDPHYNGVAFHVTADSETSGDHPGSRVNTLSGRQIHFLVLGSYDGDRWPGVRGIVETLPGPISPDALTRAGDQRFMARSSGLSIQLRLTGGDQTAWAAVLDCLGYARNRRAFRKVAQRVPWRLVSEAITSGTDALPLLIWGGGFGPRPEGLRSLSSWRDYGAKPPEWVNGGRPDNRPERRLAAAAVFAGRWVGDGPLRYGIDAVRRAESPRDLIQDFSVPGGPAHRPTGNRSRAIVGTGRAREITVNAVLPLVHAWSVLADRWDVAEKAISLYRAHPKLPANAVTREMTALLRDRDPGLQIKGAREQQGLILMYRAMTAGRLFATPAVPGENDRTSTDTGGT